MVSKKCRNLNWKWFRKWFYDKTFKKIERCISLTWIYEPYEIFIIIFYTAYLGWNVENSPTWLSRIIYLNNVTSVWWNGVRNGVNLINSSVAFPGNTISEGFIPVFINLMHVQQRRVSATIQRTSHPPVLTIWRIETRDPFIDKASKLLTENFFSCCWKKKNIIEEKKSNSFWIKRDKSRYFLILLLILESIEKMLRYILIHDLSCSHIACHLNRQKHEWSGLIGIYLTVR